MNVIRSLALSAVLCFLLITSGFAQEAIGERPSTEETPAEEQGAAPSAEVEPESQSTPKPKSKPKPKPTEQTAAKGIDGMTPEQFKAAGLDKLSPEELKNLDASLKGYQRKVETKATEQANASVEQRVEQKAEQKVQEKLKTERRKAVDHYESRVDGTITKLTGHSIITLEDGTRWKQANSEDNYKAQVTDHPSATVYKGAFGYKMRIAGLPEIYVDPVRE